MITLKTQKQVEQIINNGQILREAVNQALKIAKPGISTGKLNKAIEKYIISQDATPTFKQYGRTDTRRGFPAASCCSPRDVLVHGIPNYSDILKSGDIISIDVGVTKNNCVADSCFSFGVGEVSDNHLKLMEAAKEITLKGIEFCVAGARIWDLTDYVNEITTSLGYQTVPDLFGHGTGIQLHEKPSIPFNSKQKTSVPNIKLEKNMVITIEPVIAFTQEYHEDKDQWTLRTDDKTWTAQFEHTILITDDKPMILTGTFPSQLVYG